MDYAKMKNAELESLLKERALPHTGKKAEMVSRLQDHDKQAATSKTATTPKAPSTDAPTAAEPAAPVSGAGTAKETSEATQSSATKDDSISDTPAAKSGIDGATKDETPVASTDFASNLPATNVDTELEKRKARAKKFGIVDENTEAVKAQERAKRFGTSNEGESASLKAKLDGALPERGPRKRGRGGMEGAATQVPSNKKQKGNGESSGAIDSATASTKATRPSERSNGHSEKGGAAWMSDKDREAAEKRKAKFGVIA